MNVPSFGSDIVRDALLTIMAVSTFGTAVITAWSKRAQRRREEKKAKVEAERAEAQLKLDQAVAAKVQEVANAARSVKSDLAASTGQTKQAICEVKEQVKQSSETIDKVHTIVNSEKTRMMEDLTSSRLLNLTLAQALLKANPDNDAAKQSVALAQALYDRINEATENKKAGDSATKK